MAYKANDSDSTIKEPLNADPRIIWETSRISGRHFAPDRLDSSIARKKTLKQETLMAWSPRFSRALGALNTPNLPILFRGWRLLEQLPTRGAEADIFIARAYGERCVLKLYRRRIAPKLEVLNKIAEISRTNSRCFVVFIETGFDEETGRWYELQEYVPQGSLRELPMETKRTSEFVIDLISELTDAIRCLHDNGIAHCDIKPANVLVRSLEPLGLILTDFGISSLIAAETSRMRTSLKGTPMYWAPETFSSLVGQAGDWWGLGMIALEILAGEHPFEGLSDSQIIHKLTIGNVEIPNSLDPIWAMMVKGLLTKDDAKRWGSDEVSRWLAGERDIPVHYEAPACLSLAANRKNPFRFEGASYYAAEDLARALAASERPWSSSSSYLRFIRQWFESNMLAAEAAEMERAIAGADPELALFLFVHRSASLPFSILGKRIEAENLRLFLKKAERHEATEVEGRIVKMLGDGRLYSYYLEYAAQTGDRDDFTRDLLDMLKEKTSEKQARYLDAIIDPNSFVWPDDAKTGEPAERLESLHAMGLPLARDDMANIRASFVLPGALIFLLGSMKTYASGVEKLEQWRRCGMFIPKEKSEPGDQQEEEGASYGNMSIEEYAHTARIRCLGHTPPILEKLDFLMEALPTVAPSRDHLESTMYSRMILRLRKLKDRKITAQDSMFIIQASNLLEHRRSVERLRPTRFAAAAICGLLLAGARHIAGAGNFVLGFLSNALITPASIFFLFIASLALITACRCFFGRDAHAESPRNLAIFAGGIFSIVVLTIFQSRYFLGSVPFFAGASLGYAVVHSIIKTALFLNRKKILNAGTEYCYSISKFNVEDFL
ncbi:MAG: protein kinase [Synergistaceae bacterium]|jgi:serine/threonine protein kinase|nr:protein kinase [Synergistaceae bacterium]